MGLESIMLIKGYGFGVMRQFMLRLVHEFDSYNVLQAYLHLKKGETIKHLKLLSFIIQIYIMLKGQFQVSS